MTNKDRRAIRLGATALGSIAIVWLVILPWWSHWNDQVAQIDQTRQRLQDFQDQTRRLSNLDRELEPVLGPAVKKPLDDLAAARTQLLKDVMDLNGKSGSQIRSVQPEAPRPLQEVPGVVRVTLQVQSMCQPLQLVQLLSNAKSNPNLLILDRMETTTGQQGPGAMNVTMVWSTLARQEGTR
jgi:hypothetical protein